MSQNTENYYTIESECSDEIVVKKSRFIGTVYHVETEEEALSIIQSAKKQYWDAKHNCYAYVIGQKSELMRFFDDGEPSGTAGKPILEVLKGRELTYTLVIVTRYFGGVLLGTGGLVRAYTDATVAGIEAGNVLNMRLQRKVVMTVDYNTVGKVKYSLSEMGINIVDEQYGEDVRLVTSIDSMAVESIIDKITDVTNGKAEFEKLDEGYFPTQN